MTKKPTYEELEKKVRELEDEILAQSKAQASLLESEAKYRNLVEQLPSAVYLAAVDESSTTLFVSHQIEEILGFKPDEWKNEHDIWLIQIHSDDCERILAEVEASHKSGGPFLSEYRMIRRDGRTIWVRDQAKIVKDNAGRPLFLQGMISDITERKLADKALQKAYDELERRVEERTVELMSANKKLTEEIEIRKKAEDTVRESEEKYRTLVEQPLQGIVIVVGPPPKLVFTNSSFAKMTGYTISELLAMSSQDLAELVHPEDREMFFGRFAKRLAGKNLPNRYAFRALTRDNRTLWLEIASTCIEYQGGPAVQAVFTDITERRRAEEELLKERDIAQKYLDTAGALIMVLDAKGKITLMNKMGCNILGYEVEKLIGQKFVEHYIPQRIRDEIKNEFQRLVNAQVEEVKYENPIVTSDGKERIIIWQNRLLYDEAGKYLGMISSGVDITDRKRAEDALRESEERYKSFIENAPIGMYTTNPNGEFTYGNRKLLDITGYKAEDWLNKPFHPIVHSDDLPIVLDKIQKRITGKGTTKPYEIRVFHASGKIMWVKITSESIYETKETGEKMLVGMQSFVEDITERKEAEEALQESEERFKETVELLPNIVCEYDITGRFTYVNSYGLEALGYTRTELEEGLHASQVFSREELSRFKDRFGMLLVGKTIPPTQYRIKCKDNTIIEVIAASSPMFKKGKIVGARSSVTPITELKRIENELKESEAKYRDLADSLPQIVYEANLEGNITFANRMAFEIFGYEKEDLGKDQNALQMLIPEDRQRAVDNIQKVLAGKPIGNREYTAQRRDGSTFPIEVLSAPIIHEGRPVGFRGVIMDLSDRKRSDEDLRQSEERYRLLAENATDIIARHTLDGEILYVSPAVKTLLGYEPEFLLGRNGFELITHPDDIETVRNSLKKLVDEQRSQIRMDFRIKRQDGKHIFVETTARRLVRKASDDDYELQSITRDITDRKVMEEELRESEAKYRLLFQNAPAGIYEFDMTTLRFVSVNEVMCEYTGYSEDEFLALDPFLLLTEESKATLNALLNEVFAGNQNPDPVEYRIKGKNGREFWILVNSRFFFEEGIPKRATAVVYDITELKRAEEERTKLEKQLQQAHRLESIGTLAGGIAHDFNNLLMGIQGRTSLILMDTDISHRHREHLRGIEDYVERAANLTSQLLGFARGGKYEVKPINLNDLLEETSEMFGRTKKEIMIHHKYQKDVWAVEADRGQIEQVLMNLYVNAWQAMPSGGELYIQTENVNFDEKDVKTFEAEPGRYVKISVTDTGIGMDEATRQRIFDPFFTTKEMGRGTGLGLASAYGIIKNHSGFISVFSEKGKGTTFTIYLPASEAEVVCHVVLVEDVQRGSETILLVDDEEMILEVGKDILHSLGYQVLIARGGYEATELYEKSKDQIDMVILDMVMPDISGGDTYDRLKEMNPEVKVLLSSGYSISGQATEILDRGCNGFIQKPFRMKELSQKLRDILDKK